MRIRDAYTKLDPAVTVATPNRSAKADDTKAAKAASGADRAAATVKVSSRARELAARLDSPALASLRERIGNGTYKVDAKAIAERLVGGEDDA